MSEIITPFATAAEAAAGTATRKPVDPAGIRSALNASGLAPVFSCRAWVVFVGSGTVTITGSGNVSSVTDNGVGDYTVNFTSAMQDAAYAVLALSDVVTGPTRNAPACPNIHTIAAGSVRILTHDNAGVASDHDFVSVGVIR